MNEHVSVLIGLSKTLNVPIFISKNKMKLLLSLAALSQAQWLTNYAPG